MNTFCSVQIEEGDPAFTEGIIEEIFAEFKRIENLFSRYRDESQISHINRYAGKGTVRLDAEVFYLIARAYGLSIKTRGAFDISLGAALDLWRECEEKDEYPTHNQLKKLKNKIGYKNMHLDETNHAIQFADPGMQLDLGAIAKGYALDRAVSALQRYGIEKAQINLGGHIYVLDTRPQLIGIRDPRFPDQIAATVKLMNSSISTSANYERSFEIGNKRFSHLINPLSGCPVETDILSASIISKDAVLADALSTAVFVLGKKNSRRLLRQFDVKAVIV